MRGIRGLIPRVPSPLQLRMQSFRPGLSLSRDRGNHGRQPESAPVYLFTQWAGYVPPRSPCTRVVFRPSKPFFFLHCKNLAVVSFESAGGRWPSLSTHASLAMESRVHVALSLRTVDGIRRRPQFACWARVDPTIQVYLEILVCFQEDRGRCRAGHGKRDTVFVVIKKWRFVYLNTKWKYRDPEYSFFTSFDHCSLQ